MSATEASPKPGAERLFPYSSPEPWTWIPGTWILPATIFVTTEGRFYRFVERTDDGWKAEEVEPSTVGNPSRIAEITEVKLQYERALAAHDELDLKMRDDGDTPEARALLSKHDEELHRLRDQLILLCNGQSPEAKASKKPDQDYWKLTLAGVLAAVLALSLIYCVKSLVTFDRNVASMILAGSFFIISGTTLSVIGIRELAKRKNRLVTGNLVGCFTIVAIAVIVAAFGVALYSVFLLFSNGGLPQ